VMVRTNLTRGNGIALFVSQAHAKGPGNGYSLVTRMTDNKNAVVFLRNGRPGLPAFGDTTLPPEVRKKGIAVFLKREAGQWKIDLHASESHLFDLGIHHLAAMNRGEPPTRSLRGCHLHQECHHLPATGNTLRSTRITQTMLGCHSVCFFSVLRDGPAVRESA
jgi:hypothetical protein